MWNRIVAGLVVSAVLPLGAVAHHSVGGNFDPNTTIEVEGEITGILWRNPHVKFSLNVVGDGGEEEQWEVETHSLSIMRRMAVADPFVEIGDRVKVAGWPALRAPHGMFVNNMLLPSGEEFVFQFTAEPADLRWSDRLWGTNDRWFAEAGDSSSADDGIFRVWSTTFAGGKGFIWLREYPLTEAAIASRAAYNPETDDPLLDCATKGMPSIMGAPYPMEFVDEGDTIVFRIEEYDLRRMIHLGPPTSRSGAVDTGLLRGPLGGRYPGGGDLGDQLGPLRHPGYPPQRRGGNRRTVHAQRGRQRACVRNNGHGSGDVYRTGGHEQGVGLAARCPDRTLRVCGRLIQTRESSPDGGRK